MPSFCGSDAPEVSRLSPRIGVEVIGLDLSKPVAPGVGDQLRHLLDVHGLLLFRDAELGPDQHVSLASEFGPVCAEFGDGRYFQYMSTVESETPLTVHRLLFHQDGSATKSPHEVISLYGLEIDPAVAVPTHFASCRGAATDLTPSEAARWSRLSAVHVSEVARRLDDDFGRTRLDLMEIPPSLATHPQTTHPLLKTHPRTGERLLYVTELLTSHIVGLAPDDSEEVIRRAYALLYAEGNSYSHDWREKDLLIWDNYSLQHARGKPVPGSRRKMRRVVVNPVDGATGRAAIRLSDQVMRAREARAAVEGAETGISKN